MNPSPSAHFFGSPPTGSVGGIPGPHATGPPRAVTAQPGGIPGISAMHVGRFNTAHTTNNPVVYNYAYNVSNECGGRASALGPGELFFIRNDAASFRQTQDTTVTWLSVSDLNAHLRTTAGRRDYGVHEDGAVLLNDWRFCGVQNTQKAGWESSVRTSDVLPMTVSSRSEICNIWLETGRNAQKAARLFLYAVREKHPIASGAVVKGHPSARPIDADGDLDMLLDDDIGANAGGGDNPIGMAGYAAANILGGARRGGPMDDLSHAWQFRTYIGECGEEPPIGLYNFSGSIGFVVPIGMVLWESPIEEINAPTFQAVAMSALYPRGYGGKYREEMKRLPMLTVLLGTS